MDTYFFVYILGRIQGFQNNVFLLHSLNFYKFCCCFIRFTRKYFGSFPESLLDHKSILYTGLFNEIKMLVGINVSSLF